jgi:hypothetical protein
LPGRTNQNIFEKSRQNKKRNSAGLYYRLGWNSRRNIYNKSCKSSYTHTHRQTHAGPVKLCLCLLRIPDGEKIRLFVSPSTSSTF